MSCAEEEEDIDRDVVTPAIYSHMFLPECGHFYANTFAGLCIDGNIGAAARDQDQGRFCDLWLHLGTLGYLSLYLVTFPFLSLPFFHLLTN